jgi:manganese/zinc/iron transport system substrate-binding protein
MKRGGVTGWGRRAASAARAIPAALATGLALAVAGGCVPGEARPADGRIPVVATIGMIGDVVERVGGERVSVTTMMGPGVDPHVYKASEGDVRRILRAELIFYNGLHLEARMGDVLAHMGDRARTVAVAEAIAPELLLRPEEFEGMYDPHVWFDVRLWMEVVEVVRAALTAHDPAGREEYALRAVAYLAELEALDDYVRAQARRVPPHQRVLITAHDAFNYFGRAYGFEVRGLQGISTVAEAGTADVQSLAEFIVARRIPAIFVESSVSPRAVRAVQAAVRARGFRVEIGGELYSDALGEPASGADSYTGMVRHNIETIVGGLLRDPGRNGR